MRHRLLLSIIALSMVSATACNGVSLPKLRGPGPMASQQARATRFDPYPENGAGPAVVGGRPPSYENPGAEAPRIGWVKKTFGVGR